MEPTFETIDLDVEESNELLFKVKVEGADPSPTKVRLVCETGDVAYMFNGHPTNEEGVVQFLLPVLKDKLKEGLYPSRVEVLIENRYFAPVAFNINFKKAVKVVAESIQLPQRRVAPQVSVSASQIIVKKPVAPVQPEQIAKPIIVEETKMRHPVVRPPAKVPMRKAAPPPAKFSSALTLRERYSSRVIENEEVIDDVDSAGEDLIRELARSFSRKRS